MQHFVETEIKLALKSGDRFPARLATLGFRESVARTLERNTLFDTPGSILKERGEMLRIRETDAKAVLTWKGKGPDSGPHKVRPEIETAVASAANLREIVLRLGFAPAFVYEKYRTEFQREASGVVTYDQTPIGDFLELEGDPQWIDATAKELEFGPLDYIQDSYARLYLRYCHQHGIAPSHMTFAG